MSVIEGNSNLEQQMAEQIEKLSGGNMCKLELATVRDGCPPGSEAVITPKAYQDEVTLGNIPENSRLFSQANEALIEFCGPGHKVEFNKDFSNSAGPEASQTDMQLSALFNPTPGAVS